MIKLRTLSVFLPAYNEETNIKMTIENVLSVLPNVSEQYEILVVNDGSKDRTLEIAEGLAKIHPEIRVINHEVNKGYGSALRSGLYTSKYEWIAFTDSDGQFDFSEISLFIEKQESTNADLVIGYYLNRAVPLYRKINSFVWQSFILFFFKLKIRDIDCGFKLISRKVIDTIPSLESERGAFISTEFLVKAKLFGFKIQEIGVHHYPRKSGSATGANINVIIKSFTDLLRLWRKLR